jgi:hypothetical protein
MSFWSAIADSSNALRLSPLPPVLRPTVNVAAVGAPVSEAALEGHGRTAGWYRSTGGVAHAADGRHRERRRRIAEWESGWQPHQRQRCTDVAGRDRAGARAAFAADVAMGAAAIWRGR